MGSIRVPWGNADASDALQAGHLLSHFCTGQGGHAHLGSAGGQQGAGSSLQGGPVVTTSSTTSR